MASTIQKQRLRIKVADGYNIIYLETSADLVVGLDTALATKVDKVSGKGLSANDFTDALLTKLNGVAANANNYSHPTYTARTGVPTDNATPGFGGTFKVTQPVSDGSGHITGMNERTITIPNATATTSAAGLMSAAQVTSLAAKMDKKIPDDSVANSYYVLGVDNGALYYEETT